jgi:type I site-specific restriction endonuclease
MTCEAHAREKIDQLLAQAGWLVQDVKDTNIFAGKGVAIREFPLKTGHGFSDYLLYVDGKKNWAQAPIFTKDNLITTELSLIQETD